MPDDWRIDASAFGVVLMLCGLAYAASVFGAAAVGFWYFGPLMITNGYLILYTWLQHTHPDVPHYGSDAYSRLKGALCTIDRPYMWIVDHCHHHIGTTHVAHHLYSSVPCYRAMALTGPSSQSSETCTSTTRSQYTLRFGTRPRPATSEQRRASAQPCSLLLFSLLCSLCFCVGRRRSSDLELGAFRSVKGDAGTQYYHKKDGSPNFGEREIQTAIAPPFT